MKKFSARQQKLRDQKCLKLGLLHLTSLLLVGLCLNGCITTDMNAYNEAVIKSIVEKTKIW